MRVFLLILCFIVMWVIWSGVKAAPASAYPGGLNAEGFKLSLPAIGV